MQKPQQLQGRGAALGAAPPSQLLGVLSPPRGPASACTAAQATRWVVKLCLVGLLLSLLSALSGLLGDLVPCLSGQWMEPEGSRLVDGHSRGIAGGDVKLGAPKALGSYT